MNKPLHMTIFDDIYTKIKSNYYRKGSLLPTESELQKIYGVSRSPVREALGKLKTEGFIVRKPGIGSIVADTSVSAPWRPMGGFSANFNEKTADVDCKTVTVTKVLAEDYITKKFNVENSTPLVNVTRVRRENKIPIFLLFHYYLEADINKIKEAGDIFYMRQFASEILGINFEYVSEEIKAVQANSEVSYLLDVDEGYPLLQVQRTSFDADYKPVEFVEYYVKTENWPYKITFNKNNLNNMP